MSYGDNRLYLYDNAIDLVITTDQFYVDNRPMNNRKLKAHKGVTNEILFNIRNRDRKLQNVFPETLRAYIIDPSSKTRVVTKVIEHTPEVGKIMMTLTAADIEHLNPGLYTIYLTRSCDDITERAIYTDQDNNVKFDIEITDQLGVTPVNTQAQVETAFLQTSSTLLGDASNTFVSSALYGNLERNFVNAQHTIAIFTDGFTGNIKIQASCLTGVPDSDDASKDWFVVESVPVTDASTKVVTRTFIVNCNWVRVLTEPTTGSVTKIQLRN